MRSSRCAADTSFLSFTIGMRQKVILAQTGDYQATIQHSLQHLTKQNLVERHSLHYAEFIWVKCHGTKYVSTEIDFEKPHF
jgi:predicted transcriptional regulator